MKLTHRDLDERARHANHDAVVDRVIDLTGPVATEKLVINLTDTSYYVDKPVGSDGPASKILLTLPDGRTDLLPVISSARWRRRGRHEKGSVLATLRRAIRARMRNIDLLTLVAITLVVGVGMVMGTLVVAFRH